MVLVRMDFSNEIIVLGSFFSSFFLPPLFLMKLSQAVRRVAKCSKKVKIAKADEKYFVVAPVESLAETETEEKEALATFKTERGRLR
jgi:hypothetical protein